MIEIQFTEGNCCNNKRWHIASSCGATHEPLLLSMYSSELLILTNCQFSSHLDYSLYYLDYNKVWDACADAAVDCQWLKSQDIEECETKPDCSCIGRDFVFSCFQRWPLGLVDEECCGKFKKSICRQMMSVLSPDFCIDIEPQRCYVYSSVNNVTKIQLVDRSLHSMSARASFSFIERDSENLLGNH